LSRSVAAARLKPSVALRGLVMLKVMNWREHIVIDPRILTGKPVIKGSRIAVELVVDLLAQGWTEAQILDSYPHLTPADIRACLAYASDVLHAERLYPLKTA